VDKQQVGIGLLASLRPAGWRLIAWVAGILPLLVGVTSLVYPDATSSLSLPWALGAIAWSVAFTATAVTRGTDDPPRRGTQGARSRPVRG
jgi:hypothetical protein